MTIQICKESLGNGAAIAFHQRVLRANRKFAGPGGTMESMVYDSERQELPEQKLWRAVITSTVQEWIHGPLRKQREAEQFLFLDVNDYRTVCFSAGIDPSNLRDRLQKIRSRKDAEVQSKASRN